MIEKTYRDMCIGYIAKIREHTKNGNLYEAGIYLGYLEVLVREFELDEIYNPQLDYIRS